MEWIDVLQRIESGEDEKTEFKRDLSNLKGIRRSICAFANGDGGLLVLGVDDENNIVGIGEDLEGVLERLTSLLRSGCGNSVTAAIGHHRSNGIWVIWVDVHRHQRGYEPFKVDGRYWIRRARSTTEPSSSEMQELFNSFGIVLTEKQVLSNASLGDIDLGEFRSFMRRQGRHMEDEPQPDIKDDLRNASVCDWLHGEIRPTLYGVMVFGRDPQQYPNTMGMFIQCSAYFGSDKASDVISAGEGKGRLDEQVQRSVGWFRSLGRRESYRGLYRTDIPLLPEAILREALVNAVIHREYAVIGRVHLDVYSNRVEVTSPGTLPNHLTVEQARSGAVPRSRNEMMANAMVVRRLMEQRGRGWLLMRHHMRKFNGSEPELVNSKDGRYVKVTFRLDPEGDERIEMPAD